MMLRLCESEPWQIYKISMHRFTLAQYVQEQRCHATSLDLDKGINVMLERSKSTHATRLAASGNQSLDKPSSNVESMF